MTIPQLPTLSGQEGVPTYRGRAARWGRAETATASVMGHVGENAIRCQLCDCSRASSVAWPFAVATSTSADNLPARFALLPDTVVLDESFDEIQHLPGAVGLLAYRGTLPKGYLNDNVIRDVRHLLSGDYVRVEEGQFIELLGRGSSVINTGGEKIYPAEVEEALLDHPAVTDAVVFGVPDPRWGEAVSAIVAAPTENVTEHDLIVHVAGLLASYKKPKRIVVRDAIERSPSGKLDMARLRREFIEATTSSA